MIGPSLGGAGQGRSSGLDLDHCPQMSPDAVPKYHQAGDRSRWLCVVVALLERGRISGEWSDLADPTKIPV